MSLPGVPKLKVGANILDTIQRVSPSDLLIKPRMDAWLLEHGDDPFSPEVAEWVVGQITTAERNRTKSFSGSSSGHCARRQIFAYEGLPIPRVDDPKLMQIFQDGTWRHLRIQAQMVEAGIIELDDLEFPLNWGRMRAKGTADGRGVVPDDHPHVEWRGLEFGLEIKGANHFTWMLMHDPEKYLRQVARYFAVGGFDLFTVYVENKNDQDIKEWVVQRDDVDVAGSIQELEELNRYVNNKVLPDRLPECSKLKGNTFRSCPYGTNQGRPCALYESWEEMTP
jgi:hypothetical protein